MARRKKKKSLFSSSLKYEIYGIIWITLSVIALAGEATVGRSLSKMFGLLLGKFYFVIPIIGIYVGLYVMVKRKWPLGWSARKSGIVIVVVALTLMSTIWTIQQKLAPTVNVTAGAIMSQIHSDLKLELISSNSASDVSITQKQISGGYIGAVVYAVLFWLFGGLGAKLMMIVLLGIGIMLITNMSYVDLMRLLKSRVLRVRDLLRMKLRESELAKKGKQRGFQVGAGKAPLHDLNEEEDEEDEEAAESKLPKRRALPLFFQLFGGKTSKEPLEEEEYVERDAFLKSSQQVVRLDEEEPDTEPEQMQPEVHTETGTTTTAAPAPIFRDFLQSSDAVQDEHEDLTVTSFPPVTAAESDLSQVAAEEDGAVDTTSVKEEAHEGMTGDLDEENREVAAVVPAAPPAKPYRLPQFRLLSKPQNSGKSGDQPDFMQTARKLEATLESFGVRAKVLEVVRGPAVTRYEIQPDIGVKVSRIVSLTDDIALALAAKDIRMEAPIPGKSAIGIEVPNSEVSVVTMREVMETTTFQDSSSKLSIAFGRDISGQTIVGNLARMPHLLVAGATGSGKSVCINGIITSILYKAKPDEVKFMMIDPKMVELNVYNGIPHLLAPVVTDPKRASLALKKIVVEMEKRYELFSKSGTRNIEGYNTLMESNPAAQLPFIVIIVDELADLMMVAANDVEDAICRLAQMARAAGIHLIIATQRPSVDVITGVIKANIPSRIAFGVSSQVDSRTILDMGGAEKLLGRGDMLFLPMGSSKPVRVQGAFLSDAEVEAVVNFCRDQGQAEYNEELVPEVEESGDQQDEMLDELYDQAVQIVLEAKQASVSLLQRRMRIGYTRAARLIDSMEARGVVGPYEGSKPREVLITMDQYQQNRISS